MLRQEHESGSVWTDALSEELRRLHGEGRSASQIALALGGGITRNAVIGKIGRMKLRDNAGAKAAPSGKRGRAGNPGLPKVTDIVRRAEARRIAAEQQSARSELEVQALAMSRESAWQPLHGLDPVAMVDLGTHDCKWPIGDPLLPGFGFCGLPAAGEHTYYCEVHRALSIRRVA